MHKLWVPYCQLPEIRVEVTIMLDIWSISGYLIVNAHILYFYI